MRQTIYIDVLVFLNTIINLYILIITGLISRSRISKWRILMGGFAGGLLACTVLLPEMNEVLSLLIKALTCAGIVFISFEPAGRAKFFRRYILFLAVNFVFAGSVLFFCLAFKTPLVYYNNSNFYFDMSAPFLIAIASLTYLLLAVTLKRASIATEADKYYELEIIKKGNRVKCLALSDTGNSLKDVFSDTPVIVADISSVRDLLSDRFTNFFVNDEIPDVTGNDDDIDVRLIPFSDISGKGFLKAFRCDEVKIKGEKSNYELKDGFVAVYNGKLSKGEYNAILNPEIFDVAKEVA